MILLSQFAGIAESADNMEVEEGHADGDVDVEAGVGVLVPGKAATKAGKGTAEAATHDAEDSKGAREEKSRVSKQPQQQHRHGEDDAGFEELPLQVNGAGGRHSGDSSEDSDSDAGLAEMDDHSRAEVSAALSPPIVKCSHTS